MRSRYWSRLAVKPRSAPRRSRRPARGGLPHQPDPRCSSRRTPLSWPSAAAAALACEGLGDLLEPLQAPLKAFRAAEQATPAVAEIPGGIGGQQGPVLRQGEVVDDALLLRRCVPQLLEGSPGTLQGGVRETRGRG